MRRKERRGREGKRGLYRQSGGEIDEIITGGIGDIGGTEDSAKVNTASRKTTARKRGWRGGVIGTALYRIC